MKYARYDPEVSASEREQVLDKLQRYTGLSKEFWEKSNLRVGTAAFAMELLRDQGKIVAMHDGRLSRPVPQAATAGRNASAPSDPFAESARLMNAYLNDELGVADAPPYVTFVPANWDWSHPSSPSRDDGVPAYADYLDDVAGVMKENPQLRIAQHSGIYDLQCSAFPADWAMRRIAIQPELRRNVEMFDYEGGHMMYDVPTELVKFTDNLVKFYDEAAPNANSAAGGATFGENR